jgi:hypothetical protein
LLLLPDWFKLGDDVALYRELNVSGVMMEACTSPPADLHEMKAWLLGQLYMDRHANATELMLDFLNGYYSPRATPLILVHMRLYTDAVARTNYHVNVGSNVHAPFFAPDVVLRSLAALNAAVATSVQGSVVVTRLQKLRLSPWYVLLFRWDEACTVVAKAAPAAGGGMVWPLEHHQLGESYQAFLRAANALLGPRTMTADVMAGLAPLSKNFSHVCNATGTIY